MNNQPNNQQDESAIDSVARLMNEATEESGQQDDQGQPQHNDHGGNSFDRKPKPKPESEPEPEKFGPFQPEAPIQGPQKPNSNMAGPEMPKEPGSSLQNNSGPMGPVNPNTFGPENKKPEILGPERPANLPDKPEKVAEPAKPPKTINSVGGAAGSAGVRAAENVALNGEDLPEATGKAVEDTGKEIAKDQVKNWLNRLYDNKPATPKAGANVGAGKPAVKPTVNPAAGVGNAGANTAKVGADVANAGLNAAKTGTALLEAGGTTGAAIGTGAVTGGIGTLVVAGLAALSYIKEHKKEIGYVFLFFAFLTMMSMAGAVGLGANAMLGNLGKKSAVPATKTNPAINNVAAAAEAEADKAEHNGGSSLPGMDFEASPGFGGVKKVNFPNNRDLEYLKSGKIDRYLLEVLAYLKDRHSHIAISHIVSNYEDMPKDSANPEQTTKIANLTKNISAHKDGLAADVSEIDYVYKVLEPKELCQDAIAAACTIGYSACKQAAKEMEWGDLVYFKGDMPKNIPSSANNSSINLGNQGDSQIAVEDAKASIAETSEKLQNLLNILNQINASLDQQIEAARLEGNTELKEKLIAKQQRVLNIITRIQANINQINSLTSKLDEILGKIQDIQNNINRIAETINKVDQAGTIFGTEGGSGVAQETITKINNINGKIDNITGQIRSLNMVLRDVNYKLENTINVAQGAVNDPNFDINSLETAIGTNLTDIESLKNLNIIGNIDLGNTALESLKSVIKGFTDKLLEGAGEDIKNQINNYLQIDLGGQSGSPLGDLGIPTNGSGSNELLRLPCLGNKTDVEPAHTKYDGNKAQVIPIKVKWQDSKPTEANVGDISDDSLSTNPLVFYQVYQPQAREKVHQVIKELLDYPATRGNVQTYKINQLITFSNDRDVLPFWDKLGEIYGKYRPANKGLFQMDESWPHIHIAY